MGIVTQRLPSRPLSHHHAEQLKLECRPSNIHAVIRSQIWKAGVTATEAEFMELDYKCEKGVFESGAAA